MKFYYKYNSVFTNYLLIISLFFISSCGNLLDINPKDKYTADTFWQTEEQVNAGLIGCYNALLPWRFYHFELDMLTSNGFAYNEANGTKIMAKGEATPTTWLIDGLWRNCYVGIGRVNTFIDKTSESKLASSFVSEIGEAKFLRAFYYLNMVDKFGGVPLILSTPDASKHEKLPRNTKEEVVTQIVKDLNEAIEVLPETHPDKLSGRVTKGAALSLKARVLLYNKQWKEAAETAKEVIELNKYKLFGDYRHFYSEQNKHNSEVIFNIESNIPDYTTDFDHNIDRLNRPAPLKELVDSYLCIDGKTIEESDKFDPEHPYENRDPRLLKTIVCVGYPYKNKITEPSDVVNTGFGLKKYTSYEDNISIPDVQRSSFNVILIRYAEVLLTYAEAQNEAFGPDETVYKAVNSLRNRPDVKMAQLPKGLTKEEMREEIRRERRVEFAFEGLYYSDILRWKTAEVENNGFVHDYKGIEIEKRKFNPTRDYLWPIPYSQILQNNNLNQNPNWD